MDKKVKEKDLLDFFYNPPKIKLVIWILLFCSFFVFGFLYNFPINDIAKNKVNILIKENIPCGLSYPPPNLSFFPLPRLTFSKIKFPTNCTKMSQDIILNDLSVTFWGIGFYPFGVKIGINGRFYQSSVESMIVLTPKHIILSVDEANMEMKDLVHLDNKVPMLLGKLSASALLKFSYQKKLDYIEAKISSTDFIFPQQNYMSMMIPALPLNNLRASITQDTRTTIKVDELAIGNPKSPIEGIYKGSILLNHQNKMNSNLDITGQLRISDEFLNSMKIIKLYLTSKKFNKVNDFYQTAISGSLGIPIIKSSLKEN